MTLHNHQRRMQKITPQIGLVNLLKIISNHIRFFLQNPEIPSNVQISYHK